MDLILQPIEKRRSYRIVFIGLQVFHQGRHWRSHHQVLRTRNPFHLIMDENNPGPYSIPQPEYINNDYKLDRETYVVKLKDIDNEIANIQKKMTEHESQLNTMRNIRKNIVKEINEIDYKTNTLFV
jgi:type I restriction-modification system DNA methylase subunit